MLVKWFTRTISIHAPRMGARPALDDMQRIFADISIHAPRMGARLEKFLEEGWW